MLLLRSGTICAHPVENRLGVIHGESVVFQQMLVQHHMAAEAGGDGHATQRWGRQMGSSSVTSRLICMGAEKVRQSNVACFSYKVFPFSKIVHITATLSATR